jgi:protein TonB
MFSEKIFNIALGTSLLIHLTILAQNPNLILLSNQPRKNTRMEIVYLKKAPEPEPGPQSQSKPQYKKPPEMSKDDVFLKLSDKIKITAGKVSIGSDVPKPSRDNSFIKELAFNKPSIAIKPDIIVMERKITLPPIEADKINSPTYISYYQIVREKIRRAAYQNYAHTETGEVYASFVISASGELMENRLIEEKSSPSQYLKAISLKSIKDASPFPAFPKELDYPKLSFNVIISYTIE